MTKTVEAVAAAVFLGRVAKAVPVSVLGGPRTPLFQEIRLRTILASVVPMGVLLRAKVFLAAQAAGVVKEAHQRVPGASRCMAAVAAVAAAET